MIEFKMPDFESNQSNTVQKLEKWSGLTWEPVGLNAEDTHIWQPNEIFGHFFMALPQMEWVDYRKPL